MGGSEQANDVRPQQITSRAHVTTEATSGWADCVAGVSAWAASQFCLLFSTGQSGQVQAESQRQRIKHVGKQSRRGAACNEDVREVGLLEKDKAVVEQLTE